MEGDAPILGHPYIRLHHAILKINGALHRTDSAAELDEHAIAGHLEDAPLVAGDQRLQHLLASGLQGGQRAGLVLLHEAAVADHIGRQNGGKPALDAFFGHVLPL
jgi:hypothetical protein